MADLIEEHKIPLTNLEVLDCGKPYAEAELDIQGTIDTLRYYAGWCDKIHGNTIPAGKHKKKNFSKKMCNFHFFKI